MYGLYRMNVHIYNMQIAPFVLQDPVPWWELLDCQVDWQGLSQPCWQPVLVTSLQYYQAGHSCLCAQLYFNQKVGGRGGSQSCWSTLVNSCQLDGNLGFLQRTRRVGVLLLRTYIHLVERQESCQIDASCVWPYFLDQWFWNESYAQTNACIRTACCPGFKCKLTMEYAGVCKAYAKHM